MANELTLKAIGIVRNGIKQPPKQVPFGWEKVVSDIVVNSSLLYIAPGG
ncbi:unnamed protein product [marine sediment metagenome]|uniref:Uncharacterized protein n=1 Tax=marine sediment metagenome TaxID=412755 RepID=X1ECD7_9ZZZZ